MSVKVRPAASMLSIHDALEGAVEVKDATAMLELLGQSFPQWAPTPMNVEQVRWGWDARVNWDTYLLTIAGNAAWFMDGPAPGIRMSARMGPGHNIPVACKQCNEFMRLTVRLPDRREYHCPNGHVIRMEKDGETNRWPDETGLPL